MITRFEEYTDDLSKSEKEIIVPEVVSIFENRIGKKSALTNKEAVNLLKSNGLSLDNARFRKIIQHIRINGLVPLLVADEKGYYISNSQSDIEEYIESLDKRINSMIATRDSIHYQMKHSF